MEDEAPMQEFYADFFGKVHAGEFLWALAADGERALNSLRGEPFDLAVLDWMLPGISGMSVLKAVRAHPATRGLGVLMVTAKAASEDAVRALDSGSDDYIVKPFNAAELLARLRSLARRRALALEAVQAYELPGLSWDPAAGVLVVEGRRVRLAPKEEDLLRIFLERPNMVHSPAFLWDAVWGYESESREHILGNVVSALRRKLGPRWGAALECEKLRGFIFIIP